MSKRSIASLIATALVASSTVLLNAAPAVSANSFGIDYYISAPFVHNTYIDLSDPDTYFEDFEDNTCTTGNGLQDAAPTVSWTAAVSCQTSTATQYGGALSTSSSQVIGGLASPPAGKRFARPADGPITVSFSIPMKYLGFWWSAGSSGNRVDFYSGGTRVLTLTTAELFALFDEAKPTATSQSIDSNKSISFTDGNVTETYPKGYFYGNPWAHSSTTPATYLPSSVTAAYNEPFTYMHIFANGSFEFDQVVLSGAGFEFDNFVASSDAQTPDLVQIYKVNSVFPSVSFNNSTGIGTMADQTSSVSAPLTANAFQKSGHRFIGWNSAPDGSGTTYSDEAIYNFQTTITLFAQWAPNFVEFDPNGGSGSLITQSSSVSSTLSPLAFQRSGFSFTGWNTSADGSGTQYADGASYAFTSSVRLFAQWRSLEPAAPPTYTGPILICDAAPVSLPTLGKTLLLSGNRLGIISSGQIDGKAIQILDQSETSLKVALPNLNPGTYDIVVQSSQGTLTVQGCVSISRLNGSTRAETATTSEVSGIEENGKKPFFATKRFFSFIGDRGQLVSRDARAIERWLAGFEGITQVTCVGSTSGIPAIDSDPALAQTRARNSCALVSKLVPEANIELSYVNGRGVGQYFRAVQIFVRGER